MNEYKSFSYYYDEIMSQIDYNDWLDFTINNINKTDKILDLACGSATLTTMLYNMGYNVEGLDLSKDMINIAKKKNNNINYYIEDMTNFNLDKKYNVITCYFDSINHIKTIKQVKNTFDRVYDHLENNGIFIFDIFSKTAYQNSKCKTKKTLTTCSYEWTITLSKPNILKHNLKIIDIDKEIIENYYEYYYNYKELINNPKFKLLKISGDFLDFYDNKSGRLLIIMQKI